MKVLVVRGDLCSHTGYSKHLRAIVELIGPYFDRILGVDLHYSALKSTVPFAYPIVDDHQAAGLWRDQNNTVTALHFTLPDGYVPYAHAYNIGYLIWETDRFRPDLFWPEAIRTMDEIWAANQFIVDLAKTYHYSGPTRVISWPHDFSAAPSPENADIKAEYLQSAGFTVRSLASLRNEFSPIFLGITTDVARKGLPILLSEWCDYLPVRKKRSLLLLKLTSINVSKSTGQLREDVLSMLAPFWRATLGEPDIAFIFGSLSEAHLASLYANSDAYITATLGEGFGGPLIECLLNDTPYISPRHTSLAELIPPSYPFILESEAAPVILRDNLPVYSLSSTWHITRRGAIAAALRQYEGVTSDERRVLISQAREYAARLCDHNRVREALAHACPQALESAENKKRALEQPPAPPPSVAPITPHALTAADVSNAYQILLRREPENQDVVEQHLRSSATIEELRTNVMRSPEYTLKMTEGGPDVSGIPFVNFTHIHTSRMTARRQEHLASLELPLRDRSVIEIGCGIGLHAPFFLDRGCSVLSTDGRQENIMTARALYTAYRWYQPSERLQFAQFDLEGEEPAALGVFEVVYCYGLLYHLKDPAAAIRKLAQLCSDILLLETSVTFDKEEHLIVGHEDQDDVSQGIYGYWSHPSRPWLFHQLRMSFDYVYCPKTQPNHEYFPIDWTQTRELGAQTTRGVFVASRTPLQNHHLVDYLPDRQEYAS